MSKKSKLTNEELIGVIKDYFNGKGSIITLAKKYGVHRSTIEKFLRIAKAEGIDSVVVTGHNRKYSKKLKIQAVKEYISGEFSQSDICTKYKIRCRSVLQQ